jgi:hypothetical protein
MKQSRKKVAKKSRKIREKFTKIRGKVTKNSRKSHKNSRKSHEKIAKKIREKVDAKFVCVSAAADLCIRRATAAAHVGATARQDARSINQSRFNFSAAVLSKKKMFSAKRNLSGKSTPVRGNHLLTSDALSLN